MRALASDFARFAAVGALLFGLAYAVSETADPLYPELGGRVALLLERRAQVEAVAVGNSHSRALDFRAAGIEGAHLWRGGQDAFESAYLARLAADYAPELRYVFMTASYGMQRVDHAVAGSRDHTERRRELYARTPLRRPLPGDLRHWIGGKLAPVMRPDHWRGVVLRFRSPAEPVALAADGSPLETGSAPLTADSLARHGAARAAAHGADGAGILALAPDTPERVRVQLRHAAESLRLRGATLVLYTPPYHESYLRGQDPAVLSEARELFGGLAAESPNVLWLDFSRHPEFAARAELFANSDHLNPEGARRFSALLRRCLDALEAGVADADASGCPPHGGRVASAPVE